ncbi:hypothetical protein A2U01_0035263, partial [Trifolium medium]|nr:hypothetical protein [Trifolium medium]
HGKALVRVAISEAQQKSDYVRILILTHMPHVLNLCFMTMHLNMTVNWAGFCWYP